jgi:hypothetical protein
MTTPQDDEGDGDGDVHLAFLPAFSQRVAMADRKPKTTKVPPMTAQHRVMKWESDLACSR